MPVGHLAQHAQARARENHDRVAKLTEYTQCYECLRDPSALIKSRTITLLTLCLAALNAFQRHMEMVAEYTRFHGHPPIPPSAVRYPQCSISFHLSHACIRLI